MKRLRKNMLRGFVLALLLIMAIGTAAIAYAQDGEEGMVFIYDPAVMRYVQSVTHTGLQHTFVYESDSAEEEASSGVRTARTAYEAEYQEVENGEWKNASFREAVSNVYDGGTVRLLKDVYLTSPDPQTPKNVIVTFKKSMTITSADTANPKKLTSSVADHEYLLSVESGILTLQDVAVDGGYDAGTAAKVYATMALIRINGGKLVLKDGAEIRNNYNRTVSGAGGGLCLIDGQVTMDGGRIRGNFACSGAGVAILREENNVFIMNAGFVENNTAMTMVNGTRKYTSGWKYELSTGGFGGGFSISGGTLRINGGIIQDNTAKPVDLYKTDTNVTPEAWEFSSWAGGYGGGIAVYKSGSSPEMSPTVIIENKAAIRRNDAFYGGGIYFDWGSAKITDSTIGFNTSTSKVVRKPGATGGYTVDNYGGHGAGIYLSNGTLEVSNSDICHNEADYYGGGIYQQQGTINADKKLFTSSNLILENVQIENNRAHSCAGMYISGSNMKEWNGSPAGSSWGTTMLKDVEIANNTASSKGGGVLVAPYQDVIVSGSVSVHVNTAPDHNNFLLDNDIKWDFTPGRIVVQGGLADDALIYVDTCEKTTPYRQVKQLVAVGTDDYTITQADFEKFRSDNPRYITLFDTDCYIYLVPGDPWVIFNSMGGSEVSPNPQVVPYGKAAQRPKNPVKDGCYFADWYLSTDGGKTLSDAPYDFSLPVTDDVFLYAQWGRVEMPDTGDDSALMRWMVFAGASCVVLLAQHRRREN